MSPCGSPHGEALRTAAARGGLAGSEGSERSWQVPRGLCPVPRGTSQPRRASCELRALWVPAPSPCTRLPASKTTPASSLPGAMQVSQNCTFAENVAFPPDCGETRRSLPEAVRGLSGNARCGVGRLLPGPGAARGHREVWARASASLLLCSKGRFGRTAPLGSLQILAQRRGRVLIPAWRGSSGGLLLSLPSFPTDIFTLVSEAGLRLKRSGVVCVCACGDPVCRVWVASAGSFQGSQLSQLSPPPPSGSAYLPGFGARSFGPGGGQGVQRRSLTERRGNAELCLHFLRHF